MWIRRNSIPLIFWIASLACGVAGLLYYSNTPGLPARIPQEKAEYFQTILKQALSPGFHAHLPTLVFFLHPKCPCSKATLGELERLMPQILNKANVAAFFVQPSGTKQPPLQWVKGPLWERARLIPTVQVKADEGGKLSSLFGARTSGQMMLFDVNGKIVFEGGITPSRGHMGDSSGREMILNWFQGKPLPIQRSKVFGCALTHARSDGGPPLKR